MGRYAGHLLHEKGGWIFMNVTFNDLFTFVIMLVAVITLVKDNKHKK